MILILDMLNQARNLTLNQDFPNQFQAIPAYQVETGINGKNGLCLETSKIINSLCKTLDKTMTILLEDLTMTKEENMKCDVYLFVALSFQRTCIGFFSITS